MRSDELAEGSNATGLRKEHGGSCEVIGQLTFAVKGVKDRDAALKMLKAVLGAGAAAHLQSIVELDTEALALKSGAYVFDTCICCDYVTDKYSWCPCQGQICNIIGDGCPS